MAQVKQGLLLDPLMCNAVRLSPARVPDTPGDAARGSRDIGPRQAPPSFDQVYPLRPM